MGVRRLSNSGTSGTQYKSLIAGITPIPSVPTIGAATNVGTSLAYNSGSATIAYTAGTYAGTTYTATSSPGSFTGTGASPITITGLSSNTAYTFTVTAANATGTSAASSASSSITATTVPQSPTIGTFTDGGDGVTGTLSFTAGATGGSAITNYSYSTDSSTYTTLSPAQTTSPLSLSGLTGGTYTFSVKAINANGTSTASGGISGTVVNPDLGAFFPIRGYVVPATAQSSITFSNIPSTYTHLQLRYTARATDSDTNQFIYIKFNGDTAANYSAHRIVGDGSTAATGYNTTDGKIYYVGQVPAASATSGIFGSGIIDILEYTNVNTYKTIRGLFGYDANGSGNMYFGSGNWRSTSAINSITITHQATTSGGLAQYSSFALYGVKS